jgi:hypothetical protein
MAAGGAVEKYDNQQELGVRGRIVTSHGRQGPVLGDLLILVYNLNRFEMDLSNGHGQFHYDDSYVGSFNNPEGKISPRAISNIVVKVTFTPDKWDALSLTSEHYQGKLKLVLGGHAQLKIPALGDYKFDAKFDDIHVNVNDPLLDDTHLCACPGWKRPFTQHG